MTQDFIRGLNPIFSWPAISTTLQLHSQLKAYSLRVHSKDLCTTELITRE